MNCEVLTLSHDFGGKLRFVDRIERLSRLVEYVYDSLQQFARFLDFRIHVVRLTFKAERLRPARCSCEIAYQRSGPKSAPARS